nr:hypothetical protein [uncultured Anaerosporobacter sp.]
MKNIRECIILTVIVATVGFFIRINTFSPTGAIRYECLLQGHIFSALFLQTKEFKIESCRDEMVDKITFEIPYEKSTATHLDYWNVMKNKNDTYSA